MFESQTINEEVRNAQPGGSAKIADGVVYYQLAGPEDGDLIVLIHGMSLPSFVWDPTWEMLISEGYRVLRYDLFGRGYSDRPNMKHNLESYVGQLGELLESLQIRDQDVNLFGFSLGAGIAAAYAVQHPGRVKRIGLIDPIHPNDMPAPPAKIWRTFVKLKFMAVSIDQKVIDGLTFNFFRYEDFPDFEEQLSEQLIFKGSGTSITQTLIDFEYSALPEIYEQVGQMGIPCCLIWGEEDQQADIETSEAFMELIPDIQFHVIEEAGHLSHYERPDLVNPLLLNFLRT